MTRDYRLFIKDMMEAIENVEAFIGDMDFDAFHTDKKTAGAVVWNLHIVGEATKNIPASIRGKYNEVPWKDMARMRDKISHFYFGIDFEVVWEVVRRKLPLIKPVIQRMLEELEKEGEIAR